MVGFDDLVDAYETAERMSGLECTIYINFLTDSDNPMSGMEYYYEAMSYFG